MQRLLSLVLTLWCFFTGSVWSAVYWDNESGDNDFNKAVNWQFDVLPDDSTDPAIELSGVDQAILSYPFPNASVDDFFIGLESGSTGEMTIKDPDDFGALLSIKFLHVGYRGTGILHMDGGSVSTDTNDITLGTYAGGAGTLYMNGGTLTARRHFEVGDAGTGYLQMNGGTINVIQYDFTVGQAPGGVGTVDMYGGIINVNRDLKVGINGTGTLNLYGGTVNAAALAAIPADSLINIAGGTLILKGNAAAAIEGLADANRIVAYGGAGVLRVDYNITNSGKTTVTAFPSSISDPDPADGETAVAVDVDLSWTAAGWEESFDVYFGTSYASVLSADHDDSEFQGNYDLPGFDLPILSYETAYFWRIDGIDPHRTGTGKVFSYITQGYVPACVFWDNDSGDQQWQTAGNWSNDTGAEVNTAVDISGATNEPVIIAGTVADEPEKLWIGAGPGSTGSLLIDGGDLDCSQAIYIGFNGDGTVKINSGSISTSTGDIEIGSVVGSKGLLEMGGGNINCGGNLCVGKRGTGTFKAAGGITNITGAVYAGHETEGDGLVELTGGTIHVAGADGICCGYEGNGLIQMSGGVVNTPKLSIPYDDNGIGYMLLEGGIVNTNELVMGKQGRINIAGGTLIIDGDAVLTVQKFINGDLIRAYNASGTVHVEYDTAEYPGKTVVCAYPDPVEWVISFEDTFNGDKLDDNKWQNPNWNGGKFRFADNVEVAGGNLILKTILRDIDNDGTPEYTAGTVSSKYFQRFGFWEASFKICDAPGINNSFWLNTSQLGPDPYNNPQPIAEHTDRIEIDIQESHWPNKLNMNLHDWRPKHVGLGSKSKTVADNIAEDFHKYGFLWEEDDDCFWYYDDALIHTNSLAAANSQSMVETLFSTLVMGGWAGNPNDDTDGTHMDVDWLRVFKRAPNANKPKPSYKAVGVSIDADLRWTAGHDFPAEVNGHDVYLGTDFSAVQNATRFSPEYQGVVSGTTFDPGTLDVNTTYYWRIDEVKGNHTGVADFNGDRRVDIDDVALLAQDWLVSGGTDLGDFCEVASHWLDSDQICKGYVWSFTTEASPSIPILIDPNTLTATAYNNYLDRDAVYAVNGAGMTGHAHASDTPIYKMWMGANGDLPKWFKVNLGDSYVMDHMTIYNFNWAGYTNRGCKNVQVFYSNSVADPGDPMDNPGNWTAVDSAFDLTQAPGADDYGTTNPVAPDEVDLNGSIARWIAIKINSHYGGGYCGLSEVLFYKRQ